MRCCRGCSRELAERERNVDLVLVDGDHSATGVHRDLEDLLASPAVGRTLILIHDTSNEEVRAGVDRVRFDEIAKVVYADLDAVSGRLFRVESMRNQLWGGLGIVVVDDARARAPGEPARDPRFFDTATLLSEARARRVGPLAEAARRLRRRVGGRSGETAGERAARGSRSSRASWRRSAAAASAPTSPRPREPSPRSPR